LLWKIPWPAGHAPETGSMDTLRVGSGEGLLEGERRGKRNEEEWKRIQQREAPLRCKIR